MTVNPFDDDNDTFFVFVSDEEEHSLLPVFAEVPDGWRMACGEATRTEYMDYIDQNWADIRPKSLREKLALDRAVDA
ncbi:Enterobactin biosynthesis protein YbdZ [Mycobacterium simulans]|uniref:Enterobactin biosynthesis protein YbdZ n=1 Tax=Mycobacterium simulans TaxID=627089 RepID=A0A7Z7NAT5_9MYCO|nr:MbtH family protein [Mycobacterium simulans]SOJ55237.1 Enterobactin biosynthesis protein YbdZ [Mycobacterium simulans]